MGTPRRAYKTKISNDRREATGRGPTPEASQEAAEKRWVAEQAAEKDASSLEGSHRRKE